MMDNSGEKMRTKSKTPLVLVSALLELIARQDRETLSETHRQWELSVRGELKRRHMRC